MEAFRIDGPASGPENMRLDEELRDGGRLYTWDGPWVSIGRFQRVEDAIVPGWTRWIRRPTGGAAVLHGHDLTVSLSTPTASGRPGEIYCTLLEPVLEALTACGLPCHTCGDNVTAARSQDCFASTDRYDVVNEKGEKVCGCAMRITRTHALLQISIPYTTPSIDPASAILGGVSRPVPCWDYEEFGDALRGLGR